MRVKKKRYPEGHFIGGGMALGILFGMPLAISLGNLAFIGTGLPMGLAVGIALEDKYKKEGRIRPLTESEKKKRKIGLRVGIGALVIGIVTFLLVLVR